ncbi:delta-60 repeat domain-containing protein [Methylovulum psychrotolerans]|nr:delta-60 repeat domain-containing protein [Methylovulum psychrotolerans]
MQADGKIVVVGTSFDTALFTNFGYGSSAFGVVRYNSDGTLDTSFSDDGKQQTGDDFSATSSVLQSDGKILVAGTSGGTSTFDFSSTYDFTVAATTATATWTARSAAAVLSTPGSPTLTTGR